MMTMRWTAAVSRIAVAAALAAGMALNATPHPVELSGEVQTPQTEARFLHSARAAFDTMVAAQIAEQTAGRDCWAPGTRDTIPADVLVRGIAIGDGAGVVRTVTFDEGWRQAQESRVWILRACA